MDSEHSLDDKGKKRQHFLAQADKEQARHPAARTSFVPYLVAVRDIFGSVVQLAGACLQDIANRATVMAILQRPIRIQQ